MIADFGLVCPTISDNDHTGREGGRGGRREGGGEGKGAYARKVL